MFTHGGSRQCLVFKTDDSATDSAGTKLTSTALSGASENDLPTAPCILAASDTCTLLVDPLKSRSTPAAKPAAFQYDLPNVFTADIALARWWKQEGRSLYTEEVKIDPQCSPHTRLHILARSKPGQRFLRRELKRLRHLLTSHEHIATIHVAMATVLDKCEQWSDAKRHLQSAIHILKDSRSDAEDLKLKEYKWLLEKFKRQESAINIQLENASQLPSDLSTLTMPPSAPVERRNCSSLSVEEFYQRYAQTSTPVVIQGLAHQITTTPWTTDHVKRIAGDCKVTLKKLDQSSVEWARLENAETATVANFITNLTAQEHKAIEERRYLFDWSIPLYCPRLAEELRIPKYFAGDFLQRTSPGSLYRDSWPSLFIAPAGLKSELHVDAFGSNFWMAMFQGSKRWLFFDKEDVPLLYPHFVNSMDPIFDVDLSKPDLQKFPLLSLTHPKECVLQAGDVLFVPAGCPHTVHNLQQSLAISANFIDNSNFTMVKNELDVNALLDERASDLLKQFKSKEFSSKMDFDIQYTPLSALKMQ